MVWEKRGQIYVPDGSQWWARSLAHLPTVYQLDSERLRVYFAGLDEQQYGRIGYVDLDAHDPGRVLEVGQEPVLDLGEPGMFDDSGVNPATVLDVNGDRYFYYVGWQRSTRVPYLLFAGLAISTNGGPFTRYARTPILDRTDREPFIRSAMTVVREGQGFRAWYVSATSWTTIDGRLLPSYVIRMATSADGIHWQAQEQEQPVISLLDDEFGFGRPWVIQTDGLYKMWYSIRSRSRPYRIGYAESVDGISWVRKDDAVGITASRDGWDSEMICHVSVLDIDGSLTMFYNGNGHGASGFGYAVWKY